MNNALSSLLRVQYCQRPKYTQLDEQVAINTAKFVRSQPIWTQIKLTERLRQPENGILSSHVIANKVKATGWKADLASQGILEHLLSTLRTTNYMVNCGDEISIGGLGQESLILQQCKILISIFRKRIQEQAL
jgi:hypothetical protein